MDIDQLNAQIETLSAEIESHRDKLRQAEALYMDKIALYRAGQFSEQDLDNMRARIDHYSEDVDRKEESLQAMKEELRVQIDKEESLARPQVREELSETIQQNPQSNYAMPVAMKSPELDELDSIFSMDAIKSNFKKYSMIGTVGFAFLLISGSHYLFTHEDLGQRTVGGLLVAAALISMFLNYIFLRKSTERGDNAETTAAWPALVATILLPVGVALLTFVEPKAGQAAADSMDGDPFGVMSFFGETDPYKKALRNAFYVSTIGFGIMAYVTRFSRWFFITPVMLMFAIIMSMGNITKVFSDNDGGSWLYSLVFLVLAGAVTAIPFFKDRLPISQSASSNMMLASPLAIFLGVAALPITTVLEFSFVSTIVYLAVLLWAVVISNIAPRLGTTIFLAFATLQFTSVMVDKNSIVVTIILALIGIAATGFAVFKKIQTEEV